MGLGFFFFFSCFFPCAAVHAVLPPTLLYIFTYPYLSILSIYLTDGDCV